MNFHIYAAIAFHERQILDVSSVTDCKMNGPVFLLEEEEKPESSQALYTQRKDHARTQ